MRLSFAFALILWAATTVSCVSTTDTWQDGPRFTEPMRTQFVARCAYQFPVPHCMCVEAGLVKEFGDIEKAFAGDDDVIIKINKACERQLKDKIKTEFETYENQQMEKEKT